MAVTEMRFEGLVVDEFPPEPEPPCMKCQYCGGDLRMPWEGNWVTDHPLGISVPVSPDDMPFFWVQCSECDEIFRLRYKLVSLLSAREVWEEE